MSIVVIKAPIVFYLCFIAFIFSQVRCTAVHTRDGLGYRLWKGQDKNNEWTNKATEKNPGSYELPMNELDSSVFYCMDKPSIRNVKCTCTYYVVWDIGLHCCFSSPGVISISFKVSP